MSIWDSISRSVKNVFVGSHKGDDFKYDPPEGEYLPEVDLAPSSYEPPDDDRWFKNPLDKMPIANGDNKYAPPERRAELEAELNPRVEENPRPEEKVAEWFVEKPDESDEIEKEKTMHQKMYEMATARYNPFSLGGSENCDSDISCNIGGSEEAHK